MKTKLINTGDYLLLVDLEGEINYNVDYVHAPDTSLFKGFSWGKITKESAEKAFVDAGFKFKKVIAYYPLTPYAKPLNLPLLPNPFENYNLEKAKEFVISKFKNTFEKYPRGSKFSNDMLKDVIEASVEAGYKFSTKAAQSKQFSLEDMKKAFEAGHDSARKKSSYKSNGTYEEDLDKYIQSLSTQQLPKEFIPEYIGKQEVVGKYIYHEE